MLEGGDGVGIARSDVHYVITEYGIAHLFGKSIGSVLCGVADAVQCQP